MPLAPAVVSVRCVGLIAEAAAGRLMDEQGRVGGGDDQTAAAC